MDPEQIEKGTKILGFLFENSFNSSKIDALLTMKKLYTAWKLAIILRWWIHHPSHYEYRSESYKRHAFEAVKKYSNFGE